MAAFSSLFYSTPRFSFWVCTVSFLGLIGGSLWLHGGSIVMWHQVFVAFDAGVVFWIGSRIAYSLKADNHVQLVTIAQQASQLAASNAELARANQFKTDLLTRAAHDLRGPLGSISLSAQTVHDELPAGSPLRPIVSGIDDSAVHLAEFVSNLLVDVASETNHIRVERQPVELPRMIADVVERFRPLAGTKSLVLHYRVDEEARRAPTALVDPGLFRQVVENLITNAIKFSPPERNVWVELTHRAGEGHRIAVRDEGPGLSAADHSLLFQKYQRLSARPTCGETSTGLGLFIVKQLVTLHGGCVWAERGGAGRGASFIVSLP